MPDDGSWQTSHSAMEESVSDEDEEEESDEEETEQVEDDYFGESLISEEEILQSCASASLSSKVFSQGSQIEEESEDPSTNQEFVEEEQF